MAELEDLCGQNTPLEVARMLRDLVKRAKELGLVGEQADYETAVMRMTQFMEHHVIALSALDQAAFVAALVEPTCTCHPWDGIHAVDCPRR